MNIGKPLRIYEAPPVPRQEPVPKTPERKPAPKPEKVPA